MGDNTAIEWTDASWNPIRARDRATGREGWFCVHASTGCVHCYAESMNRRLGTGIAFKAQNADRVEVVIDPWIIGQPTRWMRPRMIFVCSMTDLFGPFVTDDMLDRVFNVMENNPGHTFQVVTKRTERAREYLTSAGRGPLPNVWLLASVEDQDQANARIPDLLRTPAAKRWVSVEPLIGPVDLRRIDTMAFRGFEIVDALRGWGRDLFGGPATAGLPRLDWVIVGGESGKGARPMHPDWPRALRRQCHECAVPFFFKQWGSWGECWAGDRGARAVCNDGRVLNPDQESLKKADIGDPVPPTHPTVMRPMHKKQAGALLDGVEYREMPR